MYPRLIKNAADGLTFEQTKEMKNRGLNSYPLMKLTRNGVYVNVVDRVREAFGTEDVVRLDCTHVGESDCKRIGVKLRDLVPCLPILEVVCFWYFGVGLAQNPTYVGLYNESMFVSI
ncbi:unnamed protein product [Linum trigynum]|uniref:CRM domain-containing protein n=1 Tax=Linum trigynum TaxID=586398 RepID=A0AAV2CDJ9_9ROSI